MKQSRLKKMLASTLALSMLLGAGTTAFAKDDDRKGNGRDNKIKSNWNNGNGRSYGNVKLDFKDMNGKEFEWALRYIINLAARGVFDGYSDGSFRPSQTVSRIEAITAAVRLMGLREQAESAAEMQTKLNFKDADKVPSWAVGYVAVAVENDLFSEADTTVNPNEPADRLWATRLLVKALKLQDEAEAKMNVKLPFKDADKIPAGSVGYVQVAIEKGLINGFEDNTFRPNQPVTRAQIAALLDRAGEQLPGSVDGLVTGTVAAPVTNNTLTIVSGGQTSTLTIDANAFIFRGGVRVSASALQTGDTVRIRAYNNNAIIIEATPTGGSTTPNPGPVGGVYTGVVAAAVNNNQLTLFNAGQTVTLTLNANALFFRDREQISASGLQVGDTVSTRSYNNAVVYVEVTREAGSSDSDDYGSTLSGTVAAPVANNVLTVASGDRTQNLTLNSGVFVYRGGVQVSASELQVGDVVSTYAYRNSTAIVEVTQAAAQPTQATGVITGTVTAPANNNVFALTSGGQTYRLTLHADAFVYRNGRLTSSGALRIGDVLTAHYYNNTVLYMEVSQLAGGTNSPLPTISQVSGTVVSASGSTLTLLNGGQTKSYTLSTKAFVYRNGTIAGASALQAGDVVTARSYNDDVIFAEVTQLSGGENQNFTVSGTFSSVTFNNQGKITTISINQTNSNGNVQTAIYNVSSSVTINGELSNLVSNRPIVLQGSAGLVTAIYIQ
ncbi:S-layer homology domain-containing protein [Paenibacillus hamazuiensis]|uniref:S-layer homology domain-containing protein n=1 Tax=Paenibacillus hamazuiensis TaxID=2936508 RepID=UPI00200BD372|nr:S-layer homology domain-containing protein [Paenibacillus hamazuiensis]